MNAPDRAAPGVPDRAGAPAVPLLRRGSIRIVVLWIVLGSVVAEAATYVGDYIDFDAARYEHLALSIVRSHSLVPRVNGVDIHSWSQLYPLVLAPFFAHGFVSTDMRNAAIASAYLMSSACIPAFLLARRVTDRRWAPYAVAALTALTPWIVISLFMMTEVAAYPACTWALFAMVLAFAAPSKRNDLFAILTLVVAFFARGELIGLVIVLPLALLAFALGRTPGGARERAVAAARSLVAEHPVLVAAYAVTGGAALVLYVQGRLSAVIGIYGAYSNSAHLAYSRLPWALVEHLATFSLGVGVVPLVIALAWLGRSLVRPPESRDAYAFACVGAAMTVVLFVQSTNFDLVVNGYIHDRFLIYEVPVVLVGLVCALSDPRTLRWSLAVPGVLVAAGFAFGDIPRVTWQQFVWLDLDTPISTVYRVLALHLGGLTQARVLLVAVALAGTGLFAVAAARTRPRPLAAGTLALCAAAMLAAGTAVFVRTFGETDRNLRPVTSSAHGTLDWIDEAVTPNGNVTAIPYPISSDWFVSEERWVDFEFFNKSIVRVARVANGGDPFDYLGFWFPKLDLRLERATGSVSVSPTPWVVQSVKETRFRIAGPATKYAEDAVLIEAGPRWRLAWRTFGLYDDGWTKPGVPMRLLVYPRPGQRRPEIRSVSLVLRTNTGPLRLPVALSAQGKTIRAVATQSDTTESVEVCVPARGYAEVRLAVQGSSPIPGDQATLAATAVPRRGGVFIASLGEADEIGGPCRAPAA